MLRVNLTQPMSLGHDCTDSGSHVLALSRQVQPLDACDENEIVCVDPAVLPFGCGYSLPELQPGPYNVIVQAFQAGSEGIVTLTLTGIQETIREICDNGIDDDRDGATDCADRKCVTEAICAKFACRADQTAGLLPLDGSPVSVVVQTAMSGDDQKSDDVRERGRRPGRRRRLPGAGAGRGDDAVGAGRRSRLRALRRRGACCSRATRARRAPA